MLVNDGINVLVEFVVMSVSICSTKENHNTIIIPTIYVGLGDTIDCSI